MCYKKYEFAVAVSFLFTVLGCNISPPIVFQHSLQKFDYVIATADNNYSLTMPQFYEELVRSEHMYNGGILERDKVYELIDSTLLDTLIGFRADRVDLRNHYEYYYRFRERTLQLLVNSYYENAIYSQISVDSSEVLEYIENHPEVFTVKEQVLVSHILISPRALRAGADSTTYKHMSVDEIIESAREIAEAIRDSINSKESFEEMAKVYSHDEVTGRAGGLVGWAKRDMYAWPFDSLVFDAAPGDIIGPYKDRDGWQILYINDHTPEGIPPLNRDQVMVALSAIKSEKTRGIAFQILDTLMNGVDLKYNEEVLDTNAYHIPKSTWAAVVNDIDTIDFGEIVPGEEMIRNKYKVKNSTADMKKELINYLSRQWVIAQEARSMGLDTLSDYVEAKNSLRHHLARLIIIASQSDLHWEPSQELMKQYYEEHIADFEVERPLRVQQIVVNDISLAQFIEDQANSGIDFMQLAEKYYPGEESVRTELVNLGWVGLDDVSKEFFDAAMVTREGEVSNPVKTEYGYHIIKVLEKKTSIPFEKARTGIRKILQEERTNREVQEFKDGLRREFNGEVTDRIFPIHLKPYDQRNNNS